MLKYFTLSEVRLKRVIGSNVKNMIDIQSYKGVRHSLFLPVRGQRTRTNANTCRSYRLKKDSVL